jgi:hypothetical protein
MPQEYPPTISVEDAAALMVNISYLPGTNGLLEMLSYFTEDALAKLDNADSQEERNKYEALWRMYVCREGMARTLIGTIQAELDSISKGKPSILEVADSTFGSEKLVTPSVFAWAADIGFGLPDWRPPRFWRKASDRSYQSAYLSIVDDVIATFLEEGGEHYDGNIPKKAAVTEWVRQQYGKNLSDKVLDAIATVIRPGLTETTKK